MPLIEVKNLKKCYINGEVTTHVLNGLNFNIDKGDFVAIMGPSGSGKSTLMHILGFLDTLTSGAYHFSGNDVSKLSDDELAKMRGNEVGFVFQSFNLLPRTIVLDNVMLPLVYSTVPKADREKKARETIESVGLGHRMNHYSDQLSGGEKQRVAIARALINNPSVIFADEPTGNLDSKSGLQVMKILQKLNDEGRTIILVTHERYTAEHAKRIIRLKDGVIVGDGPVEKRLLAEENGELVK
ncbi:MAG: ABC transporter ATPase [Candidatus Magasanikbacteria bacterium GW2011_GWA2_46_17]|uniref:ABC transporter ATPase n=1 Tax=Candidatus Magasanikbacteria bacterium GW2011_GWA2_46_17 TaxID=1619042 RepID=A0A0G1RZC4_9BACT|nr:MAG: ABC transporter ATPase [Candidatus Magasanikbacteria bacterium GW2011_GWA2_46_17]